LTDLRHRFAKQHTSTTLIDQCWPSPRSAGPARQRT
jgi:hypothetical protein